MTIKTADQVKTIFNAIARAYGFERIKLCRQGNELCRQGNDCSLKFFRSKEWIDHYIEYCNARGADLPDRELVETTGCTLYVMKQGFFGLYQSRICCNCENIIEDDVVWLMFWNHFLHAAKSYDIYIGDNLTSKVLVAKARSTEESILIGLDLAGFKVELDI